MDVFIFSITRPFLMEFSVPTGGLKDIPAVTRVSVTFDLDAFKTRPLRVSEWPRSAGEGD